LILYPVKALGAYFASHRHLVRHQTLTLS
jgi:hypothetical protein